MRQADVKIGTQYLTLIGETLGRVVVVGVRETRGGRTGFIVRRFEESAALPKVRTAAALRETYQKDTGERGVQTAQASTVPTSAPRNDGNWTRNQSTINPLNTELRFQEVPSAEVRAELKQVGFRWSGHNKCWYGTTANLPTRYQKAPHQLIAVPANAFTGDPGEPKAPLIDQLARQNGTRVVNLPVPGPLETSVIVNQRPIPLHLGVTDWAARTTSPACGADATNAAMTVNPAIATCMTCKGLDRMIPVGPTQTGQAFTMDDGTKVETTLHELYPAQK